VVCPLYIRAGDLPFFLQTADRVRFPVHRSVSPSKHGLHTLRLLTRGALRYCHAGTEVVIEAPAWALFAQDAPGILIGSTAQPPTYDYVRFAGTYASTMVKRLLRGNPTRVESLAEVTELVLLMRACCGRKRPWREPDERREIDALDLRVGEILRYLMGLTDFRGPRVPAFSPAALDDFLHRHLDSPTDIDAIAAYFGLGRSTLMGKVRQSMGTSLLRLHERMKIDWAKELLASGAIAVSDVARHVGYEDPLYFSRVFKKHCQVSPRQWQDQARVGDTQGKNRPRR
jgi:AraC-like DNA-binding protein